MIYLIRIIMTSGAEYYSAVKEGLGADVRAIAQEAIANYGQGDVRSVSVAPIVQHFAFDTFDVTTELVRVPVVVPNRPSSAGTGAGGRLGDVDYG